MKLFSFDSLRKVEEKIVGFEHKALGFFKSVEQEALHVANGVYTEAKAKAEQSAQEVEVAKAALAAAVQKAADHAHAAHLAAVDALEKAKAETYRLTNEVNASADAAEKAIKSTISISDTTPVVNAPTTAQ